MSKQLVLHCVAAPYVRFFMERDRETVGRSRECSLHLDAPTVSRYHAEIRCTTSGFVVCDEGSRNGTFVDDVRISSCVLVCGQLVRFGSVGLSHCQHVAGQVMAGGFGSARLL